MGFGGLKSLVKNITSAASNLPTTVEDVQARTQRPLTPPPAGGISPEQAQQLASTYQSGNTAGLQSLVNQYGVTQADVNKYFPGFNVSTAGVQLTPGIKTQQQADVLADKYWTGDTAGLQQAVNQMGVTQADVQKYFPGFDASKAGVTFADQQPAPGPLWSYTGDLTNKRVQKDTTKINDILESWQSTGTLTPAQEIDLQKLGKRYGEDLLNKFRSFQTATTVPETVSEYAKPTTYDPNFNLITGLTGREEKFLDDILAKYRAGETLSQGELTKLQDYATRGNLGTTEELLAKTFTPTAANLYGALNYEQEQKLAELVNKYVQGDKFGQGKLDQLNTLLGLAGLGNVESYFSTPTYTNVAGYEDLFGKGEIIGASQATTPTGAFPEGDIWSYTTNPTGKVKIDTEDINDILKSWRQTGELTPFQKLNLRKYGDRYNTDFLSDYSNFQTQATNVEDIIREFNNYINQGDEFAATQYARSLGLDEAEILTLLEGYGTQKSYYRPVYTLNELKNLFAQGTAQGDEAVMNYMTANLGTKDDIQELADTLNNPYLANTANTLNKSFNTNLTGSDIKALGDEVAKLSGKLDDPSTITTLQNFVKDKYGITLSATATKNIANYLDTKLQTADDIYETYSYENLKDMSGKEMENFIQRSAYNRLQEAGVLGGLLTNVFGFDSDDTKGILRDVMSSEAATSDPEFRNIYNRLLRSEDVSGRFQDEILATAARLAPESKFWTKQYDDAGNLVHDGEMLYQVYSNPITQVKNANANQYGTYNGVPMLNANLVEKAFTSDSDNVASYRDLDLTGIGWNIKGNQDYESYIKRGVDAVGIDSSTFTKDVMDRYDRIMSDAATYGFQKDDQGRYLTGYRNDEGGNYPVYENPTVEYYEEGTKDITADVDKLKQTANQLGIKNYTSLSDLYNKVDAATKDLYMVVGETTGLFDTPEGKNHAAAFYKHIGNTLVSVGNPQYFKYEKPKKSWWRSTFGSDLGGFFEDVFSMPLISELTYAAMVLGSSGTATPAANAVYAGMKAGQVAARPGADVEDVLKAGGLAWLTAEFVPDITSGMAEGIASLPGISDLPAGWNKFVSKAGANAVVASGIAGLTNQDMGDAFLNALATSGIKAAGSGLEAAFKDSKFGADIEKIKDDFTQTAEDLIKTNGENQFSFKNIDPRFKDLVQNIVIDTMFFDKDFNKAVQDGIARMAMSVGKTAKTGKSETTKQKVVYT